jgi:cytochrome c biogenesis protein CcdA
MVLLVLAFLGGILTIISPCILPVLPFVFSKADQPFRRSGLPLLGGMALTFTEFAAIATVGGSWTERTSQCGRVISLVVLATLGLTLLWPAMNPFPVTATLSCRPQTRGPDPLQDFEKRPRAVPSYTLSQLQSSNTKLAAPAALQGAPIESAAARTLPCSPRTLVRGTPDRALTTYRSESLRVV